jgi:hypothetical protein
MDGAWSSPGRRGGPSLLEQKLTSDHSKYPTAEFGFPFAMRAVRARIHDRLCTPPTFFLRAPARDRRRR